MSERPLRVVVVEDSLTVRRFLVDILESAAGFEVVGEATDGRQAIELCTRLRPDVVTMDMMLPVMSGLSATEYIMAFCPTPILVVSASTNRGELYRTYDALAAGAVDVLDKPVVPDAVWSAQFLSALRVVSRVRVITHPRARLAQSGSASSPTSLPPPSPAPASSPRVPRPQPIQAPANARAAAPRLVAIGASTGGPGAVLTVLRDLPATFSLPILLVIHISEPFGLALADWLDAQTRFTVRYAVDGERLPEPHAALVLMAPPGRHLIVQRDRLRVWDGPERHSCRPSVDVLFESLVELAPETIACLLTGMGRDGALGLGALRAAGATTVAQDEATSIIFGMPGEAVKLGAAQHVLALGAIGDALGRMQGARGQGEAGPNGGRRG